MNLPARRSKGGPFEANRPHRLSSQRRRLQIAKVGAERPVSWRLSDFVRALRRRSCAARPAASLAARILDDAHALDPARVGVEHVELEAGNGVDDLAARRHAAERVEDHAADRVDVLAMLAGRERIADGLGDLVDLGLAVDDEDAVAGLR